jgi:hypothetical protein
LLLGGANELNRAARRDVQQMQPATRPARQGKVARRHELLRLGGDAPKSERDRALSFVHLSARGKGLLFAVLGIDRIEGNQVFHGPPREKGILDAAAVVGEQAHRGLGAHHLAEVGEGLTGPTPRQGAGGDDVHQPRVASEGPDLLDHCSRVCGRIGVGHRADRGVAAGRRRSRRGHDRLFVLAPRLADVSVEVDEARSHDTAARLDDLGVAGVEARRDGVDHSVPDEDVCFVVSGRDRVDDSPTPDEIAMAHA